MFLSCTEASGSVTPILISRFLLNLRQVDNRYLETENYHTSHFSIPQFRIQKSTVLGNMGEDLDHSVYFGGEIEEDPDEVPSETYQDGSSVPHQAMVEMPRDTDLSDV